MSKACGLTYSSWHSISRASQLKEILIDYDEKTRRLIQSGVKWSATVPVMGYYQLSESGAEVHKSTVVAAAWS